MRDNQRNDTLLEDLLRQTEEDEAPVWLKRKIMNRVNSREPRPRRRWIGLFLEPLTIRFSPVGALSVMVLVAAAFLGGIMVERHTAENSGRQSAGIDRYADDAETNYRIGRTMLEADLREEALRFFRKAAELEPERADYVHWQGLTYWALGDRELERQSYFQTVQEHPEYLPSLLNLGHSYLESGNYNSALQQYRLVLRNDPDAPEALYNSALAYRGLNDDARQRQAFKRYLESYRTGKWAHRAVEHLHELGDFTFRDYRIGLHRIVVNTIGLLQADSSLQRKEVEHLARVANGTAGQELHIVVYNKKDKDQARETALNLRSLLIEHIGSGQTAPPIRVSWFDTEETISTENGAKLQLSPSILLFSKPINAKNRRSST
jgi:tetratricopeptide (TPR) repeat protein